MKKYYFVLIAIAILFFRPWFWKFTRVTFDFDAYPYILNIAAGLILGFCYLKYNGKNAQMLFCVIVLPVLATELMWFLSYLIHHAANDVHLDATVGRPAEMYRDFNSYFDFAYGDGNWKFRFKNMMVDTAIISASAFSYLFIKSKWQKK